MYTFNLVNNERATFHDIARSAQAYSVCMHVALVYITQDIYRLFSAGVIGLASKL